MEKNKKNILDPIYINEKKPFERTKDIIDTDTINKAKKVIEESKKLTDKLIKEDGPTNQ